RQEASMPRISFESLSLEVPPGWGLVTLVLAGAVEEQPTDPRVMSASPPRQFRPNVVVTVDEPIEAGGTLERYVEKRVEGLLSASIHRREAAPPERVRLAGGRDGLLTEQVIVSEEGGWVHQLQLATIKDGVAYLAIASHLDGEPYQRWRDTF